MDLEFPNPNVNLVATIGDDRWLICTSCLDAWESQVQDLAMVICPKCKQVMHNPRYKDQLPHY